MVVVVSAGGTLGDAVFGDGGERSFFDDEEELATPREDEGRRSFDDVETERVEGEEEERADEGLHL